MVVGWWWPVWSVGNKNREVEVMEVVGVSNARARLVEWRDG